MKKFIFILFFLTVSYFANSQQYGNEWIKFDQQYFRINIAENGIYRLNYDELKKANIPVEQINPKNIQIFYKGQEIPVFINKENDGFFHSEVFIEFYGEKNSGELDSILYEKTEYQPNPYYSIFTDTISYFISWNNSFNNKRLTTLSDNNFTSYTASPYCLKEIFDFYKAGFYSPAEDESRYPVVDSRYTAGEGWMDASFLETTTKTKTIQLPNIYTIAAAPDIKLKTGWASNNKTEHNLQLILPNKTIDEKYTGLKTIKREYNVPVSSITASKIDISLKSLDNGIPSVNSKNSFAYNYIKYPKLYNFENNDTYNFIALKSSADKTLVEIVNFNGGDSPLLYDMTNNNRIFITKNGAKYDALLNSANNEMKCFVVNQTKIKTITANVISPITFTDFSKQGKKFLIITHPSLWTSALEYQAYRDATLVNVEELYAQFSYGIPKHSYAIRGFLKYVFEKWGTDPEYMLLLGKGLHTSGGRIAGYNCRLNATNYKNNILPSFGNPSNDALFSAGLKGGKIKPAIATGRISARNNEDVLIYLNKLKEYESNQPAAWMKNVLHFSGGDIGSEGTQIDNYLKEYEIILEDTLFGANVSTFRKIGSDVIEDLTRAESEAVQLLVNNGITICTLFGHGSASGFSKGLEDVNNYDNKGKYPFIIGNSCLNGDLYLPYQVSDMTTKWTFTKDKGSIAFLGTIGYETPGQLNHFMQPLHNNIAYKSYNLPLGKIMQNTIGDTENINPIVCLDLVLQGDPMVKLNQFDKPDLVITKDQVTFTPNDITSDVSNFDVDISVLNQAKITKNNFDVIITRTYPNGKIETYKQTINGCYYEKLIKINMPVSASKGSGMNKIKISLDIDNKIEELSESNNEIEIDLLIKTKDITPIYPYKYAIYPDNKVILKAVTGDILAKEQTYKFELDTIDSFNSNFKMNYSINQTGGLVKWDLPITLEENKVYYWRVCNGDNNNWQESSFIHIKDKNGWSQAHYQQFKEDDFLLTKYNKNNTQNFSFLDSKVGIRADVGGKNSGLSRDHYPKYDSDNSKCGNENGGDYASPGYRPAILVAVIDKNTLCPWNTNEHPEGQANYPWGRANYYLQYEPTSATQMTSFANLLNSSVSDGNYILAYTAFDAKIPTWSEESYKALENLGATKIRTVGAGVPYIFFAKKGDKTTAKEVVGVNDQDIISISSEMDTPLNFGYINSNIIGPAAKWETLHWDTKNLELTDEEANVSIIGIKKDKTENVLVDKIDKSINTYDLQSISADTYPNLKLSFYTKDGITQPTPTPSQLSKWQIYFDGIPETTFNNSNYSFSKEQLIRGGDIKLTTSFENISKYDMDSLLYSYWIEDSKRNIIDLKIQKLRKHPAGDILIPDTIKVNTINLLGDNTLWVEINPFNKSKNDYDQAEQYHFNNILSKSFFVQGDGINPLLDVTFNGRHILNGDIVSSKPQILITLKDENKFLILNDTASFRIFIIEPNGTEKQLFFASGDLQFTSGTADNNQSKVLYNPNLLQDGTYKLVIKSSRDISKNESGERYELEFKVINKSTITNILNYPNPFSSSTKFVFTLTGNEVPDNIKIQIFSVSGKLVKTINKSDLGNIVIGNNITEYAWDGTDDYGDKLANGVYFYKVLTSLNGKSIEKMENETSTYFKKEFGKMYLMR